MWVIAVTVIKQTEAVLLPFCTCSVFVKWHGASWFQRENMDFSVKTVQCSQDADGVFVPTNMFPV